MTREDKLPTSTMSVDKGWAWMIVVGVFLEFFCFVGIGKSMGLIAMELVRKFDVPMATAILPATILFSTFAIASPLAVIAGEIFSIQKVVIFGSLFGFLCISLASLLFSLAYYILLFGIGIGLGGACYYGNGLILLGQYFRRRRSLANGLAFAGGSVGHFVLPPIIEYVLTEFGLAGTTLIISAIFLQGAISGALFRPIGEVHEENDASEAADDNNMDGLKLKVHLARETDVHSTPTEGPISAHDSLLKFQPQPSSDDEDQTNNTASQTTDGYLKELISGKVEYSLNSSKHLYENTPSHEVVRSRRNSSPSNTNDSFDSYGYDTESAYPIPNSEQSITISRSTSKRKQFLFKLSKAMDFRVLKNYITVYYTAVAFLCFSGYINVVLYLPAIFMDKGINLQDSAILVLVSGGGEIVSRVGIGFLADKNFLPRYVIMGVACCCMGLDIFMLYFVDNFWWAAVHSFLYGFTGGIYACLVVVVLVDLVGLEELNRNMVVILLIEGVGSSLGQFLLGALKDSTGSCDIVIILCSASSLLGGLLELSYPLVRKFENRRLARQHVCS